MVGANATSYWSLVCLLSSYRYPKSSIRKQNALLAAPIVLEKRFRGGEAWPNRCEIRTLGTPIGQGAHLGARWADFLEILYAKCRTQWDYRIPDSEADLAGLYWRSRRTEIVVCD